MLQKLCKIDENWIKLGQIGLNWVLQFWAIFVTFAILGNFGQFRTILYKFRRNFWEFNSPFFIY